MLVLYSRHWQGVGVGPSHKPDEVTYHPSHGFPNPPSPACLVLFFSVLFITGWHNVYLFTVLTMFHAHTTKLPPDLIRVTGKWAMAPTKRPRV